MTNRFSYLQQDAVEVVQLPVAQVPPVEHFEQSLQLSTQPFTQHDVQSLQQHEALAASDDDPDANKTPAAPNINEAAAIKILFLIVVFLKKKLTERVMNYVRALLKKQTHSQAGVTYTDLVV